MATKKKDEPKAGPLLGDIFTKNSVLHVSKMQMSAEYPVPRLSLRMVKQEGGTYQDAYVPADQMLYVMGLILNGTFSDTPMGVNSKTKDPEYFGSYRYVGGPENAQYHFVVRSNANDEKDLAKMGPGYTFAIGAEDGKDITLWAPLGQHSVIAARLYAYAWSALQEGVDFSVEEGARRYEEYKAETDTSSKSKSKPKASDENEADDDDVYEEEDEDEEDTEEEDEPKAKTKAKGSRTRF